MKERTKSSSSFGSGLSELYMHVSMLPACIQESITVDPLPRSIPVPVPGFIAIRHPINCVLPVASFTDKGMVLWCYSHILTKRSFATVPSFILG